MSLKFHTEADVRSTNSETRLEMFINMPMNLECFRESGFQIIRNKAEALTSVIIARNKRNTAANVKQLILALATTGGLTHSNELKREDFRQEKMKLNVVNYSEPTSSLCCHVVRHQVFNNQGHACGLQNVFDEARRKTKYIHKHKTNKFLRTMKIH
ncbi:hypothetical protein P5673_004304 [Acropora cervicornis]|uniref:Uncharacterized protein n=1 Tax=Acropora cervicornis TaxID=6130 RepID=A0AAD9VE64_ACRCE|nr:hypothetical protein P5673_004304 [Acropora cervicornis]